MEINGSVCFWVITSSQEGTILTIEDMGIAIIKRTFTCDSEVLEASLSIMFKQALLQLQEQL